MAEQNEFAGKLNTIDEALQDIRAGKIVIVVDNEDRENEGDFICAAELVTPEIVNFMAMYGRGLICTSIPEERCAQLDLQMMVGNNTSLHTTAFTVSVDLLGQGCTTGISASDRAKTILALVNPDTKPDDLARPGHIFPLRANSKGVLRRAGHTEAAIDLTRLAGLASAGVLVEIMNDDGTMARLPQLVEIAARFNMKIVTIQDLIAYRLRNETLIERGVTVNLPTEYGNFTITPYRQLSNGLEHVALVRGTWKENEPVLVRVHSSCLTGDVFGSMRCDCGDQLHESMRLIDKEGCGVVVYLNQEGRGIGLFNKIKAYELQEQGRDTVDANLELGFAEDERDYGVGAQILRDLGVTNMRLLTNNPKKRVGLEGYGLKIVENIAIHVNPNEHNQFYMETKANRMGHEIPVCRKPSHQTGL